MSRVYIVAPLNKRPSGGMGVLSRLAKILKENLFDINIIYTDEHFKAYTSRKMLTKFELPWYEEDISDIPTFPLGDGIFYSEQGRIKGRSYKDIAPQDILVVPEVMGEIMTLATNYTFKKVVLAQSWAFMYQEFDRGDRWWTDVGFDRVICTSQYIKGYFEKYSDIKRLYHYRPSISTVFKPSLSKRDLKVCFSVRSPESQVISDFAISHARRRLRNIKFDANLLQDIPRRDFAEALAQHPVCLFTDHIAGFGTFPLEAMKTHTHCIGFITNGGLEYMTDLSGSWIRSHDPVELGNELANILSSIHSGSFDWNKHIQEYDRITNLYNRDQESENVINIFHQIDCE